MPDTGDQILAGFAVGAVAIGLIWLSVKGSSRVSWFSNPGYSLEDTTPATSTGASLGRRIIYSPRGMID